MKPRIKRLFFKGNKGILVSTQTVFVPPGAQSIGYEENSTVFICSLGHINRHYIFSAPLAKQKARVKRKAKSCFFESSPAAARLPVCFSRESNISFGAGEFAAHILPENGPNRGKVVWHTNIFGQKRKSVFYKNFFGPGAHYVCTPVPFGINTEIILEKKPEKQNFNICLALPGLAPDVESPDYILFRTENTWEAKMVLYAPFAADAANNRCCKNTAELIKKDSDSGVFTARYNICKDFLHNAHYPVRLNQSVYRYVPKQPDTAAYSEAGEEARHYLSPYLLLGKATDKGEGWAYIRYETLQGLDILAEDIVSAKYVFRNLTDLAKPATVGAYAVNSPWCSLNTRWFNRPENDDKPVALTAVQKKGDYALDITPLLKEVMRNKGKENARYTVRNGFMLKTAGAQSLLLASADNGLFTPYLQLDVRKKPPQKNQ